MKKMLHIIVIILNVLLFTSVYFSFCEKDVSDIYHLFGFANDKVQRTVEFLPSLNNQKEGNFYRFLQELSDEFDIDVVFMDMDYSKNRYHMFIQTNANLKEVMNLETKENYSFKEGEKHSYSNKENIYLFNPDIQLTLSPLSTRSGKYPLASSYVFYAKTQKNLDLALSKLEMKYRDDIAEIVEMNAEEFNLEEELSTSFQLLFLISILSYILIIFYMISNDQKKIAILKMNGVSSLRCVLHLFLKTMVIDLGISLFVLMSLFVGVIGIVNSKTVPIIEYLFKGLMMQGLLFIGVVIIAMFVVHCQKLGLLIKGKNFNKILLNGNYGIKILLLLFLVPMSLEEIQNVKNGLSILNYFNQNESLYEQITTISSFKKTESRINYDPTWFYSDPENQVLKFYGTVFDKLNENGAVLCNANQVQLEYNTDKYYLNLEVNGNYLKHHPILDKNGQLLDLDTSGKMVYILGDKEHIQEIEQNRLSFYMFNQPFQIIEMMDNQNLPDYDRDFSAKDFPKTVTVYSDNSLRFDKSFLNSVYLFNFDENEMNKILEEFDLDNKLDYIQVYEEEQIIKKSLLSGLIQKGLLLSILFLLFIFQVIQFIYLYYKTFSQRMYVKKMMGYSSVLVYYPILIESACAYLIPIVLSKNKNQMTMFVLILLLIEWMLCVIYDRFYNRKEILGRRNKS